MSKPIIIVTGVSKGIGKQCVLSLIKAGYRVAGWGRSPLQVPSSDFHFFKCDVSVLAQVESAMLQTRLKFGDDFYGLINNAGFGHFGLVEELPIEQWHAMFNTNVHGLMYCTRAVVPFLKAKQAGHIINISSIAGLDGVVQGSGYSATKYAVRGISHSLYKELREDGIKVSCIYPGSVETNFFDQVEAITPSKNMLQAEDVALCITQLIQSSANFLTVDVELRPLMPKGPKVKASS